MSGCVRSCLIWVLLAFVARDVQAILTLELSSSDDFAGLHVGDSMRIDVGLAGLDTGASESLVTLTAAVQYPSSLLGTATATHAGAIIPDPLDNPLNFQLLAGIGQIDGVFITFSTDTAHQIHEDGPLWTFELTAGAPGSGEFVFDPLTLVAEQYDPNNSASPILRDLAAGAPLPFTISRNVADGAVPEPTTTVVCALGLIALAQTMMGRRSGLRQA